MSTISGEFWFIQALTLSRLLLAVLFAAVAFQAVSAWAVTTIFVIAAVTDLVDGWLARQKLLQSELGMVLDLVSDKCLSLVAIMYAAVAGISFLPLFLIGLREVVSLGFRILQTNGKSVLPSSRLFGGLMAGALWTSTAVLINIKHVPEYLNYLNLVFWSLGLVYAFHITHRIFHSYGALEKFMKSSE